MLSETAESPAGMDLEGMEFECRAGQSWGEQVEEALPLNECVEAEDLAAYAITNEAPLGVLSDDELKGCVFR